MGYEREDLHIVNKCVAKIINKMLRKCGWVADTRVGVVDSEEILVKFGQKMKAIL